MGENPRSEKGDCDLMECESDAERSGGMYGQYVRAGLGCTAEVRAGCCRNADWMGWRIGRDRFVLVQNSLSS